MGDMGLYGGNGTDCAEGVHWIWVTFGQCLVSPVEISGFYLGLFSIFCWFLVYIPQLYENYKRQRCDDALSIWFLLFWLLGDTCNLVGCFLTHQFPIQTMTAIYYVAMDLGIIIQYVYYDFKNRRTTLEDLNTSAESTLLPSVAGSTALVYGVRVMGQNKTQLAGYIIGLLSTVFYLGSRLPQIIMNFKRGKTDGVSYLTFLLAVIANFAYAFSVLMGPRAADQSYMDFVLDHLPWLSGSLGTVFLDLTILLQCLCLNNYRNDFDDDDDEQDENRPLLENQ